jgi:hypothetical protein
VIDLIFDTTTVILLVLLVLIGALLVYMIVALTKVPTKKYELAEEVRPLVGVVMPNESKRGKKK